VTPAVTLTPGTKRPLLDASPSPDRPWYINDHTLIRDRSGTWHVFGIWHPEPAAPLDETFFLHASAPSLADPAAWTIHEPVLHARTGIGETHVWAPHVIAHEDRYWMFYCGGTADHTRYRIELATSTDLVTWQHHDRPLCQDGYDARDPMVLRAGGRWLLYYTRTSAPEGGFHEVAVRESEDLVTWSAPRVAFRSSVRGTVGGPTESPFVVPVPGDTGSGHRCGRRRCGRRVRAVRVRIRASTTGRSRTRRPTRPGSTEDGRLDADLDEHCAEIVADGPHTWITGGGWGRQGLTIRELRITRGTRGEDRTWTSHARCC
jgi:arabinan endo-1,5-alpha-L-arabinosidase